MPHYEIFLVQWGERSSQIYENLLTYTANGGGRVLGVPSYRARRRVLRFPRRWAAYRVISPLCAVATYSSRLGSAAELRHRDIAGRVRRSVLPRPVLHNRPPRCRGPHTGAAPSVYGLIWRPAGAASGASRRDQLTGHQPRSRIARHGKTAEGGQERRNASLWRETFDKCI